MWLVYFRIHISSLRADVKSQQGLCRKPADPHVIAPSRCPQLRFGFDPAGPPPGIRESLGLHVCSAPGFSTETAHRGAKSDVLCTSPLT